MREHAHDLLDRLGPNQLAAIVHLLETMIGSGEEGDTLSRTEREAIAEADNWLQHNEPIPHERVLAEFGLTTEDWERMCQESTPADAPRRNG